mmetsp:Transcript_26733/g.62134  ORF Transcript_26733/g.62134 Transcript_26733/m.62134 type:complete len:92 (-) Transcript_26733:137-412(-)
MNPDMKDHAAQHVASSTDKPTNRACRLKPSSHTVWDATSLLAQPSVWRLQKVLLVWLLCCYHCRAVSCMLGDGATPKLACSSNSNIHNMTR